MFRGGVKGTGYPLNSPISPSLPLPCVTVCHHVSTGLYHPRTVPHQAVKIPNIISHFGKPCVRAERLKPLKAERSSKRCPLPSRAPTTDFISEQAVFTLGLSQSSAADGSLQIRTFYKGYDVTQGDFFS